MKDKKRLIILLIVLLILIITNLVIYVNKIVIPNEQNKEVQKQYKESTTVVKKSEDEQQKELLVKLRNMTEAERIQTYIGQYIKHIESKEYEKAYDLLYPEFKQNYFKTLEEYTTYVQNTYPEIIGLTYLSIQLEGEYYVCDIIIKDFLNVQKEGISIKMIVQENNYNDYKLSFQLNKGVE